MRDNLNIEELSDQAWHKMSVMLDKEMPVQDGRKKRPFYWWLFGAGILLAILIAFLQWSTNVALPAPQIKSLPIPQRIVAENNGVETKSEEEKATKTASSELTNTVSNTNENKHAETRSPQNQKPIVSAATNHLEALQIATQKLVNSNRTRDPKLTNNVTTEVPILQEEAIDGAVLPTVALEEEQQQEVSEMPRVKPAIMRVDAILGLPIEPFSKKELSIDEFERHLPEKSSPFTFGLGAGLISKNLDAVNGVFAELRTGLRLGKNSKFSLIGGIGFHYEQEPLLIQMKSSNDNLDRAISVPEQDLGSGVTSSPLDQQEFKNLAEAVAFSDIQITSTFLDAPIAVNWQVSPRWSFELGGRVSWQLPLSFSSNSMLLQENASPTMNGNFTTLGSGSRNQLSFYQITSSNSVSATTLTFRNWSLATTAAVNFKLNPKWTLRLQYQYGLTNRLDDSNYQMLDRSLWLGVGRRF